MVKLLYSEINIPKKTTSDSTKLNVEAFRENYTVDDLNTKQTALKDNAKYDYDGNVLLYNTPLPHSVTDTYNSDLNEEINQQNYLYIVGIFSMGVLLVYAINLARN